MKINVTVEMPDQIKEDKKHLDLCEKCDDYITVCESDEDSKFHFTYLKSIYNKLSKSNKVPEKLVPLLEKLEEFMLKHDNDRINLEAEDMFKHTGDK